MGNHVIGLVCGLMLFIASIGPAEAELDVSELPPQLLPWTAWVLHDAPDIVCPEVASERRCDWPGELLIEVSATGATFSMAVYADRVTFIPLPGDRERWPQGVQIDGSDGVVGSSGDAPSIQIPAGSHRVSGSFVWSEIPQMLVVPSSVGRVTLRLESGEVEHPRIDGEGRLWLREGGEATTAQAETDSARASVYRKISDGVPLTVTTRLRLNVSGRARELSLGKVLIEGSRPIAVRAAMPVQVTLDGEAKIFARPGSHDIEIDAVFLEPVTSLVAPKPEATIYEPQEVWVWAPIEEIRSVELGGLTAVDPERTSLPDDWRGFTTFLAEPGAPLTLRETRRGIEEEAPNVISLDREIWLDLDRGGYTARDRLTGTLNRGWRLDYAARDGDVLGRVAHGGENLLITQNPEGNLPGVELRSSQVDLTAELRLERDSASLPIVGWDHDIQRLSAQLHLPPGWTLLGGKGVDTMRGTWMESWTLWDFFFVLIVAFIVGRLFGWRWSLVAAAALFLAHGQQDAPRWIWIHLLVSLAILRALSPGWPRKVVVAYRAVALAALVVVLAPFAHSQILHALHPQVSRGQASTGFDLGMMEEQDVMYEAAPASSMVERKVAAKAQALDHALGEDIFADGFGSGSSNRAPPKEALQQIDPNAVVQTGPGLPDWTWSTWSLEWTGPVRRDHVVTLWLLSPLSNAVLGFLRVFLLLMLALLLVAPRDMYWERERAETPRWWRRFSGAAIVLLAASLGLTGLSQPAHAQTPDSAMLGQLRDRLEQQTKCPQQPCVVASHAEIAIDDLELRMSADVSALADTGWVLPGPPDALRITSVAVDGVETTQLRRDANGMLLVRLEKGAHQVTLQGRLADRNVVTLQFAETMRPRHLQFDARDWAVDGISPTGVPDNSIQLTRTAERTSAAIAAAPAAAELPPWYQVRRRVALGLPWRIYTEVSRADANRPQLVKIPLVEGEKVISEGVRVEHGFALVDFARGENGKEIVGELPVASSLKLVAAKGEPWTETWTVECSRIWRCDFSGLPPVSTTDGQTWRPQWRPWPGETLEITVERPKGAPGQPKTIDNVTYTVTPGKRLVEAALSLSVRASQGDWQEVVLPEGAELQTVSINGTMRTIRPEEGKVRLPVQPGSNSFELSWQQPWTREVLERVPQVDIGGDAANAHIEMLLGEERWLLGVRNDGIQWGPAVLFWPHLLILILLALILGTLRGLPLKWPEWLLLVFGMSQLPVVVMLVVVCWFVLVAWRGREPLPDWRKFDLVQIAIVMLTLSSLGILYAAVHTNLLLAVDMQVDGMGSSNYSLRWYVERVSGALPTPGIVSVPLFVYRIVMFVWALWLVWRLMSWARWGWTRFSIGGRWRTPSSGKTKAPKTDGNVGVESSSPKVERNARDGELVKKEFELKKGASEAEPDGEEE